IAIRVHWCRPMRKEEIASWDGGKSTWEGRVRVFGTVPLCVRVQERAGVRDEFWREGITRKLPDFRGKGKGIDFHEQAAQSLLNLQKPKKQSIRDQYIFQRRTLILPIFPIWNNLTVRLILIINVVEEQGGEVSKTMTLEERTVELDEGQAGSDPVYHAVHENLKLTTEELVHLENPPSSSETLSSIKNLKDTFTFGDQFLNDKSTKEEPRKANVETKVESMVTIPIHQASSSVPLLSTPIIDLSPPKPVSPPVQEPIFIATSSTITTPLPLPPQQSTTDPNLDNRVIVLENKSVDFDQKHQLQDKTTKSLASMVYKLENHNLYLKIDKKVSGVVKEAVHNAFQALLREHFRHLLEFKMKEILHDRMFESGSYRSHLDHTTLYGALEVCMQRKNNDELHAALAKSRKRRRDDQDPLPPPPKDSGRSKKKKHDSDASALKQPLVQKPSAWKTSDSREAPTNSSKKKPASLSKQPINDDPIPKDLHLSESAAYLLMIKTRPD
nr:hypothetical protein [Tanacetum cinerariifolium]